MTTKKKKTTTPRFRFPNGVINYLETHHEVVAFISHYETKANFESSPSQKRTTAIDKAREAGGTCEVYTLARTWTNEFEVKNKGREWDGEFFDEIEAFCAEKNKSED